jgi:hypothetical protein
MVRRPLLPLFEVVPSTKPPSAEDALAARRNFFDRKLHDEIMDNWRFKQLTTQHDKDEYVERKIDDIAFEMKAAYARSKLPPPVKVVEERFIVLTGNKDGDLFFVIYDTKLRIQTNHRPLDKTESDDMAKRLNILHSM